MVVVVAGLLPVTSFPFILALSKVNLILAALLIYPLCDAASPVGAAAFCARVLKLMCNNLSACITPWIHGFLDLVILGN